jgi:hypothetical protein
MFAVIVDGVLLYAGTSQAKALEIFHSSVNPNTAFFKVESAAEIAALLKTNKDTVIEDTLEELNSSIEAVADGASKAFQNILNKLDELGVNENLAENVVATGEKLVVETRNLGVRGMQVVGEGFIALGDLLRSTKEK